MFRSIITGSGSYIPPTVQPNSEFENQPFYSGDQQPLATSPQEIVEKFKEITGIEERRTLRSRAPVRAALCRTDP